MEPLADSQVRAWVEKCAAVECHGDVAAFIERVLRAAMLAEQEPEDRWANLRERTRGQRFPKYQVPVEDLVGFVQRWNLHVDGGRAEDVLDALRAALGLPAA